MYLPELKTVRKSTEQVVRWLGYNHVDAPAEGSFYDCQNVSTALYPLLACRGGRPEVGTLPGVQATLVRDKQLYWVSDTALYRGMDAPEKLADLDADTGKKRRMIGMGAWVIVFPDGVRYNIEDGTVDRLAVENSATGVQLTLCKADKTAYTDYVVSNEEPEDTTKLWMDTGTTPHVLKQYTSGTQSWISVGTTYVRLTAAGLGRGLAVYDAVNITGVTGHDDLSGDMIVYAADDDGVMVAGIIDAIETIAGTVTVKREMPELDYVTECNNRIWGCSSKTNEICACKLGDPTNWACYMGLNSDSYRLTVGAPGDFTGAVTFLGYVLFFKEDCLLKLFGTKPSNYQISQTNCRGVEQGSEGSLVIVNETLYYKSPVDVVSYDGGLPATVSEALGGVSYREARAAAVNGRYYINMRTLAGDWRLFCYDVEKQLWSREDNGQLAALFELDGTGYQVSAAGNCPVFKMLGVNEPAEGGYGMNWWAETGMIGLGELDAKYLNRFQLRMWLPVGSTLTVEVSYEDGEWVPMQTVEGSVNRSVFLPVLLRRCDHAALRLSGTGPFKLFNMNKVVKTGGEVK